MPAFVQILDFIGTFAFAISGIRLASAKRFDWFGAYVVGLVTAIGGGTMRDVYSGVISRSARIRSKIPATVSVGLNANILEFTVSKLPAYVRGYAMVNGFITRDVRML